MILLSIFTTVEFYVITAFIAAAVIAACSMPSRRGAARTFLYAGELGIDPVPSDAGIVVIVNDHGAVEVYRFGIEGVRTTGAYSLAVSIIGFDVTIKERLTPGSSDGTPASRGSAVMDCFGPERYHFQYISESTGRNAAFSLNIRPGNRIERRLG